ncbi:dihydrofolate reductase [Bacillus phage SWEP1]|nr:dihydrofolate reductase [Bacillus phage SWEP1]
MTTVSELTSKGVFIDYSLVNINTKLLDVLTNLITKAKNTVDNVVTFKKTHLATELGKDVKTVSSHLKELQTSGICEIGGERGRGKGCVVRFNELLVKFDTSDKAIINSDDVITLDTDIKDIVKKAYPKKPKRENPNKRNRRTKKQMLEDRLLQSEKQQQIDELNDELAEIIFPTWDWFQKTDAPVHNYKAYLISRMYNRYAYLFATSTNYFHDKSEEKVGFKVPEVSPSYDVLEKEFMGTINWTHFVKFVDFCEENDINPAVYLTAQFNLSTYSATTKSNVKSAKPFPNALMSEGSYEVYKREENFQNAKRIVNLQSVSLRKGFADDPIIMSLDEAYKTAEKGSGILSHSQPYRELFRSAEGDDTTFALVDFYDYTMENMKKNNVSKQSQAIIKKFITTQAVMHLYGKSGLPENVILGSEMVRIALASIQQPTMSQQEVHMKSAAFLGNLLLPRETQQEQYNYGGRTFLRLTDTIDHRFTLRLIEQRRGLHVSLKELQDAFKEYGRHNIPLNDYSFLDVEQIEKVFQSANDVVDYDLDKFTVKSEYNMIQGSYHKTTDLDALISEEL